MTSGSLLTDARIEDVDGEKRIRIDTHSLAFREAALVSGFATEAIISACTSMASIYGWEELRGAEKHRRQAQEWLNIDNVSM